MPTWRLRVAHEVELSIRPSNIAWRYVPYHHVAVVGWGAYGAFYGQITEHRGGHIDFWLYMPSDEIRRHGHWVCFQHRGNDWYIVHMARMPKDVSSGIIPI